MSSYWLIIIIHGMNITMYRKKHKILSIKFYLKTSQANAPLLVISIFDITIDLPE